MDNASHERCSRLVLLLPVFLLAGLTGCRSTAGLFLPVDHHPELMQEARDAVTNGQTRRLESTLNRLERRTADSSQMLYLLERARLMNLSGNITNSVELYNELETAFDDEMLRATFTVSRSMQAALATVTNDRALAYRGHLYERLLVYYFQSLNYLRLGQVAEARIELNKALRDMRWGSENLPRLRAQSDQSLAEAGIRPAAFDGGVQSRFPGLQLENSFENGLIFYLSGLLFEINGDLDRAEIDYRNALAVLPGTDPFQDALQSLKTPLQKDQARLVILHESDWVSPKIPFSFAVFIRDRSYTLSFPFYAEEIRLNRYPESFIEVGGNKPLLYPVLNLDAVVRKSLDEEFSAILLRQAIRMVAKQEIQKEAEEADPWLGLAASIFSILSDSPDLRSWLSLPASIYLTDLRLAAGEYPVRTGMDTHSGLSIALQPGEVTVLHVVTAQGRVISIDSFPLSAYLPAQ